MPLLEQLFIGSLIIVATILFHVLGLVVMAKHLKRHYTNQQSSTINIIRIVSFAVICILALHTAEAWLWAAVYFLIGEFNVFADALYFSVVTSTTLGYGDIVISEKWRILGTFESMGGLILFGISTAFMIEILAQLFREE